MCSWEEGRSWQAECGSSEGLVAECGLGLPLGGWWWLTFIISTMVLRAIMAMMVYSKGGDTTNCHIRYWKLCLFWGMCLVSGLALMAKSMQALCGRCQRMRGADSRRPAAHSLLVQMPRSLMLGPAGITAVPRAPHKT